MSVDPQRGAPRRGKRARAILLAWALGLVGLELSLQLAAWALAGSSGRGGVERGAGLWVLCHGDSNVYGVYEDAQLSYPAQLQALLNSGAEDEPHRVRNMGLPGLNSRQLVRSLERVLEDERPDALLVTIGANNEWSWTPAAGVEEQEPPWYERLRLVRLVRLASARFQGGSGSRADDNAGALRVASEEGDPNRVGLIVDREGREHAMYTGERARTLDEADKARVLREDLAELQAHCAAAEVALWVVSYGSDRGKYGEANAILRAACTELGVALIDVVPAMEALVAERGFEAVHFLDLHPRALGYARIAEEVLDALIDAGAHQGERARTDLDALAERAGEEQRLFLVGRLNAETGSAEELALEVRGALPERGVTLLLWGARRPDQPAPDTPPVETYVELLDDPLFRRTLTERELTATLDAQGNARVGLSTFFGDTPREALAGLHLRAAYIVHGVEDEAVFANVSRAVSLQLGAD